MITMNDRLILVNGVNPYASHLGFKETGCHLRITVTPSLMGSTSCHGFSCDVTGGHCLPSKDCDTLRTQYPETKPISAAQDLLDFLEMKKYLKVR